MASKECLLFFVLLVTISANLQICQGRSVNEASRNQDMDFVLPETSGNGKKASLQDLEDNAFEGGIRSDVIQTQFPGENKPGWMRRQLMRFGNLANAMTDKLGGSAAKVAGMVEKLCKILKTMIPIVAAVCHVGQFKFCSSPDGPTELADAIALRSNPIDLNIQD